MTEELAYNLGAIRELLLAAFTPETLRRLCHDHPLFHPIVVQFGPGHGLADMVDEVITYCETNLLLPELLAEVAQKNPRQYDRYASSLWQVPPSPPTQPAPDPLSLSTAAGAPKAGTTAGHTVITQTGSVGPGATVISGVGISNITVSHGSPARERKAAESPPEELEKKGGVHDAG